MDDAPNNVLVVSVQTQSYNQSNLSSPATNTPVDGQPSSSSLDAPVIMIKDAPSGSLGDYLTELEKPTEDSGTVKSLEIITIKNEPVDPESEPEVAPCLVATSPNKRISTSSRDLAQTYVQ